jgi:hypothetical protein
VNLEGGLALIHGAIGASNYQSGGFGGGGGGDVGGGGGGGGYNGGGGGGGFQHGVPLQSVGGGGGSYSLTTPLNPYTQSGVHTGNGAVNICYAPAATPVRLQSFTVD